MGILCLLLIPTFANANSTTKIDVYVNYSMYCECPKDLFRPGELLLEKIETYINKLRLIWGMDVQVRTIDTEPELEGYLIELYQKFGVPDDIPTKYMLVLSVDDKYLFINRVPVEIVTDFLDNHAEKYRSIIVYKDETRDLYKVIDDVRNIMEGKLENSISEVFSNSSKKFLPGSTLYLVVISGLLDGINPCAFTVMLFLVTFLLLRVSITHEDSQRKKGRILLFGSTYILAVYLTYLIIGLTLREAIGTVPFPHLVSKIGALVVIIVGLVKMKDAFWPGRGINLKLSSSHWEKIRTWMRKGSLPTTFTVGVLVAIYEFPCTGGIYISILSILATRTTFLQGLKYLIIYNIAFILPLIAILLLASNKEIINFSLSKWQEDKGKNMSILESLIYIGLGLFLLISDLF